MDGTKEKLGEDTHLGEQDSLEEGRVVEQRRYEERS